MSSIALRTADPFKDLGVIDARAPRFNQTVVAIGAVVATFFPTAWPVLAVLGLQLTVGLLFGRQYCLPCLFYFVVIQPRVGEGHLEDSRAPRFANILGAVFLGSAALSYSLGFTRVGWGLGLMVAVLATLAATTGLCVGCELYRVVAKFRGVKGQSFEKIDLQQVGAPENGGDVVVHFTHPLCSDCQTVEANLKGDARPLVKVDVSKRKDLAKKYGIAIVPQTFVVRADGKIAARLA